MQTAAELLALAAEMRAARRYPMGRHYVHLARATRFAIAAGWRH